MQVAAADPDSGRRAGRRLPPVGADHQPRGKLLALAGMDDDGGILRVDRRRLIVEPDEVRKLSRALFEGDQPSQLTKDAMNFCSAYTGEAEVTRQFIAALRAKDLLVDRRLDFTLPGDKKFAVDGFQIIDAQKLTDLDAETVADWHRKGWLAASYAHLQSLNRVNELLDRRARRLAAATAA